MSVSEAADLRERDRLEIARSISDYEKLSGILWIVLGCAQVLLIVTALAGVWNIVAGVSRLKMAKHVAALDPRVPAAYEGLTQLILIGLVNLVFGGVIGLIFVGLDAFIRDRVLSNRWVFSGGEPASRTRMAAFGGAPVARGPDLGALEQLGRLKTSGVLTQDEFEREKARVLGVALG